MVLLLKSSDITRRILPIYTVGNSPSGDPTTRNGRRRGGGGDGGGGAGGGGAAAAGGGVPLPGRREAPGQGSLTTWKDTAGVGGGFGPAPLALSAGGPPHTVPSELCSRAPSAASSATSPPRVCEWWPGGGVL